MGYDTTAHKISEDSKKTAGEPVAIRLTPHAARLVFALMELDVALVDVEVIDAKGQRCPTALNVINFSIDGPAEWRGGIAQGPDNYVLSKSLPVENGVNRVIIRASHMAGKIVVRATARDSNPPAFNCFASCANSKRGLSLEMPDAGLTLISRTWSNSGCATSVDEATVSADRERLGRHEREQARLSFWTTTRQPNG